GVLEAALRGHLLYPYEASIATGAETLDVVGGVRAEQLGLGPVGPAGERAARGGAEDHPRVVRLQPRRAVDAGFDGVALRWRDDRHAVPPVQSGVARGAVDVGDHVAGAAVRLAGAAPAELQPPAQRGDVLGRHLPRVRRPPVPALPPQPRRQLGLQQFERLRGEAGQLGVQVGGGHVWSRAAISSASCLTRAVISSVTVALTLTGAYRPRSLAWWSNSLTRASFARTSPLITLGMSASMAMPRLASCSPRYSPWASAACAARAATPRFHAW